MDLAEMNRIKEERGYSFSQLSAYTGVPAVTLQKIFSGNTKNPRTATLNAIERVLLGDEKTYGGKSYDYESAGKNSRKITISEPVAYNYGYGHSADRDTAEKISEKTSGEISEKKQGEYTVEDYQKIPEEQRMELIDGVLYDMASPKVIHQDCASIIHMAIYDYIRKRKGKCKVWEAPVDVRLDKDNHTMVVPDVLVVCDRDKIREREIYGAPDFILEILSPSTRNKDMTLKLSKYEAAGVREYWILDPDRQRLITYNFMEKEWIPQVLNLEGKVPLAIFDGECEIDLDELAESIRELNAAAGKEDT